MPPPKTGVKFAVAYRTENAWQKPRGRREGFRLRDLGIADASGGKLSAQALRTEDGLTGETGWQHHTAAFRLVYVLTGWCDWEFQPGRLKRAEAGTFVCIPPHMPVNEHACSAGMELLEVSGGAINFVPCQAPRADAEDAIALAGVSFVFAPLREESWKTGAGRRAFLDYRTLASAEQTGGRVRAHVTRANGLPGRTGWHYHTCDLQVVYRLQGSGGLLFEPGKVVPFDVDSCMCIPPGTPHDEQRDSRNSVVLEVLIGEMGTVACEEPRAVAG